MNSSFSRYQWTFVGWYFGFAAVLGMLSLATTPKLNFLSLFLPTIAANLALRMFQNDEGRRLDVDERTRMIRFGLVFMTVMTLVYLVMIKLAVDANPYARLSGRTLGGGMIVFTLGVSVLVNWAILAISFRVAQMFLPPLPRAAATTFAAQAGARTPASAAATGPGPVAAAAGRKLRMLVIGSGAREHALAWKLAQSPRTFEVLVAPGNAGTAGEPKCRNVAVDLADIDALVALATREKVDLTVVGPEGPLVAGVVDRFRGAGLRVFGPSAAAAQLEGSKAFAKEFMLRHGIPTARHAVFTDLDAALAHVRAQGAPIVIKADGLAAGKGVVVAPTLADAEAALTGILASAQFGLVGNRVVVEEFLEGEETSFIVMVDGDGVVVPMATSQDHKRIGDGDTGPNTGGMGAYSPAPVVTPALHARILHEVIEPTVLGMETDGIPFSGFLYAGLMIGRDGAPKVIEFNVRFGDPEAQPVLMRLQSDLPTLLEAAVDQRLGEIAVRWNPQPALAVVMAAAGYPDSPRSGDEIHGLAARASMEVKLFHGGTRRDGERTLTAGGRVLTVCALGGTLAEARMQAYDIVAGIGWDGEQHRSDIGHRALPGATTKAVA